MKRLICILFCAAALVGCQGGFTAQEREVIYGGEGDVECC